MQKIKIVKIQNHLGKKKNDDLLDSFILQRQKRLHGPGSRGVASSDSQIIRPTESLLSRKLELLAFFVFFF